MVRYPFEIESDVGLPSGRLATVIVTGELVCEEAYAPDDPAHVAADLLYRGVEAVLVDEVETMEPFAAWAARRGLSETDAKAVLAQIQSEAEARMGDEWIAHEEESAAKYW